MSGQNNDITHCKFLNINRTLLIYKYKKRITIIYPPLFHRIPVLPRGHSGDALEVFAEEGGGEEIHLDAYLFDRQAGGVEQGLALGNGVFVNPVEGGAAGGVFDDLREVFRADAEFVGIPADASLGPVVFAYQFQKRFDNRFLVTQFLITFAVAAKGKSAEQGECQVFDGLEPIRVAVHSQDAPQQGVEAQQGLTLAGNAKNRIFTNHRPKLQGHVRVGEDAVGEFVRNGYDIEAGVVRSGLLLYNHTFHEYDHCRSRGFAGVHVDHHFKAAPQQEDCSGVVGDVRRGIAGPEFAFAEQYDVVAYAFRTRRVETTAFLQ